MASKKVQEGKTIAIIAYLSWIGLLIAFIMNNDKQNEFAKFHIRQSLVIFLAYLAVSFTIVVPILGWIFAPIAWVCLLIFWVIGFVAAINGEEKEVPLVGKLGQEWFKGL